MQTETHCATGRRVLRWIGIAGLAGLLTASLGACSIIGAAVHSISRGGAPETPGATATAEVPKLSDSPYGFDAAWLDPRFARGVGNSWATSDEICAIDNGTQLAVTWTVKGGMDAVVAIDLSTGKEVWTIANASCLRGQIVLDEMVVMRYNADSKYVPTLIKVKTGETVASTDTVTTATRVRTLANASRGAYIQFSGSDHVENVGLIDMQGRLLWSHAFTEKRQNPECYSLAATLGCVEGDGVFRTYNEADGKLLAEVQVPDDQHFTIGWDGYGVQSMDDSSTEFHDLAGKLLKTVPAAAPPEIPARDQQVFFSLASFTSSPRLSTVTTDGAGITGVPSGGSEQVFFATKQPVKGYRAASGGYVAAAEDGSVVALLGGEAGENVEFRTPSNRLLATVPSGMGAKLTGAPGNTVLGGLFVTTSGMQSVVFLPKGF